MGYSLVGGLAVVAYEREVLYADVPETKLLEWRGEGLRRGGGLSGGGS